MLGPSSEYLLGGDMRTHVSLPAIEPDFDLRFTVQVLGEGESAPDCQGRTCSGQEADCPRRVTDKHNASVVPCTHPDLCDAIEKDRIGALGSVDEFGP